MISSKHIPVVLTISVAVLAVAVGVISIFPAIVSLKYDRYDRKDFIDSSVYQAVFLTNDQIYFGNLKSASSDYLILSDVYYVNIDCFSWIAEVNFQPEFVDDVLAGFPVYLL